MSPYYVIHPQLPKSRLPERQTQLPAKSCVLFRRDFLRPPSLSSFFSRSSRLPYPFHPLQPLHPPRLIRFACVHGDDVPPPSGDSGQNKREIYRAPPYSRNSYRGSIKSRCLARKMDFYGSHPLSPPPLAPPSPPLPTTPGDFARMLVPLTGDGSLRGIKEIPRSVWT